MINLSINFKVIQGDNWSLDIAYTDSENNPINISDYTIIAEVRDKPGGQVLCATSTNGDGIEMIDDGNYNRFLLTFDENKTSNFNYPRAAYQVKVVDTGDSILDGWFEVNPGVIKQ